MCNSVVFIRGCPATNSVKFQNLSSTSQTVTPISLLCLAVTTLLPVPMDLPVLDISYKENHTVCDLSCLAYFILRYVFGVHSRCSMNQYFISFCALATQSCPTLCNPRDCNPPASSIHGILQARILE